MTHIPTNAGRVEPVYGWAAVAPDGQIQTGMIFHAAIIVRHTVAKLRRQDSRESYGQGWRRAYRAGWRVIRVQISPAGEREEKS